MQTPIIIRYGPPLGQLRFARAVSTSLAVAGLAAMIVDLIHHLNRAPDDYSINLTLGAAGALLVVIFAPVAVYCFTAASWIEITLNELIWTKKAFGVRRVKSVPNDGRGSVRISHGERLHVYSSNNFGFVSHWRVSYHHPENELEVGRFMEHGKAAEAAESFVQHLAQPPES